MRAYARGTQVIWDLCHWGLPADIDILSEDFVTRFAAFARAAASLINGCTDTVPFFCAINEISFWAWVGGDVEAFHPHLSRTWSGTETSAHTRIARRDQRGPGDRLRVLDSSSQNR